MEAKETKPNTPKKITTWKWGDERIIQKDTINNNDYGKSFKSLEDVLEADLNDQIKILKEYTDKSK